MPSTADIAQKLKDAYDEAVADLPLEDAIEVAEDVHSFIGSALMGLQDDLGDE